MKDLDFKLLDINLFLDPVISSELYSIIRKDVEYLSSVEVMDYSILLGICENYHEASNRYTIFSVRNEVHNIGFIDFIQEYDIKKKVERKIKKTVSNQEISSLEPAEYARSFIYFIKSCLLGIS